MDSRWPLVLLLGLAALVALGLFVGLLVLVHLSPLPSFAKSVIAFTLVGLLVPGAGTLRRSYLNGRNPWAKDSPERG